MAAISSLNPLPPPYTEIDPNPNTRPSDNRSPPPAYFERDRTKEGEYFTLTIPASLIFPIPPKSKKGIELKMSKAQYFTYRDFLHIVDLSTTYVGEIFWRGKNIVEIFPALNHVKHTRQQHLEALDKLKSIQNELVYECDKSTCIKMNPDISAILNKTKTVLSTPSPKIPRNLPPTTPPDLPPRPITPGPNENSN